MAWSARILTVSGIAIRVHVTFGLIIVYFAIGGLSGGPIGAAFGVLTGLLLFVCVTLHELGHSLVAQRLGVPVREIVLLPIGGVARLAKEPRTALHELLIAVAGPLVNVGIALALGAVALLLHGRDFFSNLLAQDPLAAGPSPTTLLSVMLAANVMLAVFNMLPALPMDGGRVFRALLSMLLGKPRATRIASVVGQVLAFAMAGVGFWAHSVGLMLVGAFVFMAAGRERYVSESGRVLDTFQAGEVCDPAAPVLAPSELLGDVVDRLLRSGRTDFAVLHGEQVVGTLSEADVLAAVARGGVNAYVGAAMRRPVAEIAASATLGEVRARIAELEGAPVAVIGPSGFVGLLGMDDLTRVAALAATLSRAGVRRTG